MTAVQIVGAREQGELTGAKLLSLSQTPSARIADAVTGDIAAIEAIKDKLAACAPQGTLHQLPLSTPESLVPALADIVEAHGPITRLDIVDHGGPGYLLLGRYPLFHMDRRERTLLRTHVDLPALAALLADTAHVRLLGCRTANRSPGRLLLHWLAMRLGGHRLVFGTIDRIQPKHFDNVSGDFDAARDAALLFSSAAAMDGKAPKNHGQRVRNLAKLD